MAKLRIWKQIWCNNTQLNIFEWSCFFDCLGGRRRVFKCLEEQKLLGCHLLEGDQYPGWHYGVFHVFKIVDMAPNRATHHKYSVRGCKTCFFCLFFNVVLFQLLHVFSKTFFITLFCSFYHIRIQCFFAYFLIKPFFIKQFVVLTLQLFFVVFVFM